MGKCLMLARKITEVAIHCLFQPQMKAENNDTRFFPRRVEVDLLAEKNSRDCNCLRRYCFASIGGL